MCQKSCGSTVYNALRSVGPWVTSAVASFPKAYAQVVVDISMLPEQVSEMDDYIVEQVISVVEMVGFDCCLISKDEGEVMLMDDDDDKSTTPLTRPEQPLHSFSNSVQPGEVSALIAVSGMSCAVCAKRVDKAISKDTILTLDGLHVKDVSVNIATGRTKICFDLSQELRNHQGGISYSTLEQQVDRCIATVVKGGYEAEIIALHGHNDTDFSSSDNNKLQRTRGVSLQENAKKMEQQRIAELNAWKKLLITSTLMTIPIVWLTCMQMDTDNLGWRGGTTIVLATLVQGLVGHRYYVAAYKGLRHGGVLGMDALVVMGTTAAYGYSIILCCLQLQCRNQDALTSASAKCFGGTNATLQSPTFETAAMLLTFVTLGKYMEAHARGKTAMALQTLMSLQPVMGQRVIMTGKDDGSPLALHAIQTQDVSISEIAVNDILYVSPGARIPTDGILLPTSSNASAKSSSKAIYVDESMLTGEPFPIAKHPNDKLFGSCVNQLSPLLMRVTATGDNTMLSRIVQLIEEAQASRAPIQAHADKIAGIFVPVVMSLSFITLIGWLYFSDDLSQDAIFKSVMSAISVLVVACPCALGLATPTAVMVGTGVGAGNGVLIKGGAALEDAYHVDTIVFDKTGTLTTGRAILGGCVYFEKNLTHLVENAPQAARKSLQELVLWLAACAEHSSEHPLSRAIVNRAQTCLGTGDITCSSEGVQVSEFQAVPGEGVECLVSLPLWGERWVRVGCRSWALSEDAPECEADAEVARARRQGHIGVYVSVMDHNSTTRVVIAVLEIVDRPQSQAKSTIAALQQLGLEVWMCTGDHELTANAVAAQVGIPRENVCAGVKPEGKADLITRLQKRTTFDPTILNKTRTGNKRGYSKIKGNRAKNSKVAFVGDGINDAVALARADVGIAIGAGTEVAVEAADMVLVKNSLHDVVVAMHLSSVVFKRIRLNFFFALVYNIFALPFAAGAMYPLLHWTLPPAAAGLMMAFSSVSVVTSSLLLCTYTRPTITEEGHLISKSLCCGDRKHTRPSNEVDTMSDENDHDVELAEIL